MHVKNWLDNTISPEVAELPQRARSGDPCNAPARQELRHDDRLARSRQQNVAVKAPAMMTVANRACAGTGRRSTRTVHGINPDAARDMGTRDGARVRLTTRRGTMTLKPRLSGDIRVDTVLELFHRGGAGAVNILTSIGAYLDRNSRENGQAG